MSILVTGGAGFIGANLCRRLLADGHRVICVDNLSSGTIQNIDELLSNSKFKFYNGDVRDLYGPLSLMPEEETMAFVNQIYNLACPASPPFYQRDPIHTMMTCVNGMHNVLALADKWGAKVVQASTSEVYGSASLHPQPECYNGNVNPLGIRACYDEGKRAAETLCMDFRRRYGVDAKIVRIFNTYGPYMRRDDGRVVSNFITQALSNYPLTIYGDGTQTRSFCYVDDLIEGLIRMMNSTQTGPINLGNPIEFTMHELAHVICGIIGSTSRFVYRDLPQDDPKTRRPEITLAKQHLNWTPKVSISDGLRKTIEYFKQLL